MATPMILTVALQAFDLVYIKELQHRVLVTYDRMRQNISYAAAQHLNMRASMTITEYLEL